MRGSPDPALGADRRSLEPPSVLPLRETCGRGCGEVGDLRRARTCAVRGSPDPALGADRRSHEPPSVLPLRETCGRGLRRGRRPAPSAVGVAARSRDPARCGPGRGEVRDLRERGRGLRRGRRPAPSERPALRGSPDPALGADRRSHEPPSVLRLRETCGRGCGEVGDLRRARSGVAARSGDLRRARSGLRRGRRPAPSAVWGCGEVGDLRRARSGLRRGRRPAPSARPALSANSAAQPQPKKTFSAVPRRIDSLSLAERKSSLSRISATEAS